MKSFLTKLGAAIMFPGEDKNRLARGSKRVTVRVREDMGKYQPGMTYPAVNMRGEPMGFSIKVNSVQRLPASTLSSATSTRSAASKIAKYNLSPLEQVELIRFEVARG